MVIINHNTDKYNLFKEVDGSPYMFLSNRNGNFLLMSDTPKSRYDGFFFLHDFRLFRILEHIELLEAPPISEIDNNFTSFSRRRGHLKERFFMPYFYNSLVYEVSEISKINLYFDVKDAYDSREWGRNYVITEERNGMLLLKFIKTTDRREDAEDNRKEYELYIAVKPDIQSLTRVDEWVGRDYSKDRERNSEPSRRYAYLPFEFKAGRIVITASATKEHALEECVHVFNNLHALEKHQEQHFSRTASPIEGIGDRHIETAYICAQSAMHSLLVNVHKDNAVDARLLAGFPWFFQVWSRDELVSLKSMLLAKHYKLCRKIILDHLGAISYDGRLPNRYPSSALNSADAIGWLFKRVYDLANAVGLPKDELPYIKKQLEQAAYLLVKYHTRDQLVYNDSLETWMDTLHNEKDSGRAGARIEVQALQLLAYRVLHRLTGDEEYHEMERRLRKAVREKFWTGKYLKDGADDITIRPNAFIAAYIYPELLQRDEWIACFRHMLPKLWLPWGGLASIDKYNSKFTKSSTGENPKSYHHGDSWFWINNMAAIVLMRLDRDVFKNYIDQLLAASTHEILWQGAIGCHAELSSAAELKSEGCLNQAWSNALYIELVHELKIKKASNLKLKVLTEPDDNRRRPGRHVH
ncbi:hypothetical protein HYV81_06520 [Candidatus Woesearchaeota archaeon]|nr:hypothetical protein [Candidatus Woesearchaeota archaeon]